MANETKRPQFDGESAVMNLYVNNELRERANRAMSGTVSFEDMSYAYNQAPTINENNRGFGRAAKDAWHIFYNDRLSSRIDSADDKIRKANFDIEDAEIVLDFLNDGYTKKPYHMDTMSDEQFYEKYGVDRKSAAPIVAQSLERLNKDGVWTSLSLPGLGDLVDIINNANVAKEEALASRKEDSEKLQSSLDTYDISQYATNKTNESAMDFGNFLYKSASMLGSSWSDIGNQVTSTLSAIGASIATEALIGSAAGPQGTAIGAASGALTGLRTAMQTLVSPQNIAKGVAITTASQYGGGIEARANESHMEAYGRFIENLNRIVEEDEIDRDAIVANVRKELAKQGKNPAISAEEAFNLAATGQVNSGSTQFDDAARRAYRGTRKLYEMNMALGAGEVATDLLFYVPAFRNSSVVRGILNPAEETIQLGKKGVNSIKSFFNKRLNASAEVMKNSIDETATTTAKKLTGKEISKKIRNKELLALAGAKAADIYEEATEEGAQFILSDRAAKGEFDDAYVSDNFMDALLSGNLISDIKDNWLTRQQSTMAILGLDPVYSGNDELFQNYLSGGLLSVLDPRTAAFSVKDLYRVRKQAKNSKQFGDIFQRAIEEQDYVDRTVDLLQATRELKANNGTYEEVLDNVAELLKSGRYDLGVISDPEKGTATNEQIDEFIAEEKEAYKNLMGNQKVFSPIAKNMGLSERDSDIFVALANNVYNKANEQNNKLKESTAKLNEELAKINKDDSVESLNLYRIMTDVFSKVGQNYTDAELEDLFKYIKTLASLNAKLGKVAKMSQSVGNQAFAQKLLKDRNMTSVSNAQQLLNLQSVTNKHLFELVEQKKRVLNELSQKLDNYKVIQNLEEELESTRDRLSEFDVHKALLSQTEYDTDPMANYDSRVEGIRSEYDALTKKEKEVSDRLEASKTQMDDILNSLENVEINNSTLEELYSELIQDAIEYSSIMSHLTPFMNSSAENKTEAQRYIKAYKDRVKKQYSEQDVANDKVKGEKVEETTETYTDEQLEQRLSESVDQMMNVLSETAATSPQFATTLERLNRGLSTIKSPSGRINYVRRSLEKFQKVLENMPKDSFSEEDKLAFDKLKSQVAQASSVLNLVTKRAFDKSYNAKRRPLDVAVDTYEWTAPDGKKYKFLNNSAEYTIDGGAILYAKDITDESDLKSLRKDIKDVKNKIRQAKKILASDKATDAEKQQATNDIRNYTAHLENLNTDLTNKEADRVVEFKVNEQQEYLNSLTRKNNKGKEISFSEKLDKIVKKTEEAIKDAVEKRDKAKEDDANIEETSENNDGAKNSSPSWLEDVYNESLQKKDKFRPKAYSYLGTKSGVEYANRLLNPYYQASEWFGSAEVQLWEDVADLDFANAKSEKGSPITWNRRHAYETFEALAELTEGKNESEIEEIFDKAKNGKLTGNKLTKSRFENMVRALPISVVLFNNRLRSKQNNRLIPTRLVMPDATSENAMTTQEAYMAMRENMLKNFLFNKEKGQTAKLNIAKGSVSIFQQKFLQGSRNVVRPDNPILLGEDGSTLSPSALNDKYDASIQAQGSMKIVLDNMDELKELVEKNLGYSNNKLGQNITVREQEVSALAYLMRGVAEFGDGIIKAETFISNYVKPTLGLSTKSKAEIKTDNVAQRLLDKFMKLTPEIFFNYDEDGGQSLNTEAAVEEAVSNYWKIRMDIKSDGKQLVLNSRTKDEIVELCEQIEDDIKTSNSKEEFIEAIKTRGLSFNSGVAKKLGDYFINRKFNKLLEPSNIIHVLTSDSDVPVGNKLIDNRVAVPVQSSIADVKSLGIIYDEDSGRYLFSMDSYKKHIERISEKEQTVETEDDGFLPGQNEIIEGAENARELIRKRNLKDAISEIEQAYGTTYAEIISQYNATLPEGTKKLTEKQRRKSVLEWFIDNQETQQLDALEEEYRLAQTELEENVESDFEGKQTQPVILGYATANGSIRYFNPYDKKMMTMRSAKGKPGKTYLILPSFFNPNRNQLPIQLNNKNIDIEVARVIATLMHKIATGQISEDQSLVTGMAPGLEVYDSIPVGEFIDSLMFRGTDAVERDPSNYNLDRLVYIKDGSVYFGNSFDGRGIQVTEDNIEEFAQWISSVKTYRIDRDLLEGDLITVRGSYSIKNAEGTEVLSQQSGDNYIKTLIDSQRIRTDLDAGEKSTLFGGSPQVYFEYTDHFKNVTKNEKTATSSKKKDSADSKKKEVNAQVEKLNKTANANLLKTIKDKLEGYAKEADETLEVVFNGKTISFDFDDSGYIEDYSNVIGKSLSEAYASNKPFTLEIKKDGVSVDTVEFGKGEKKTSTVVKDNSKAKAKSDKVEIEELDLSDVDDYEEAKKKVNAYYKKNKNRLPEDFVSTTLDEWLNGDEDPADPSALDMLRKEQSVTNRGKAGASEALKRVTPEQDDADLPTDDLTSGVTGKGKKEAEAPKVESVRPIGEMLEDVQTDTMAYLLSKSKVSGLSVLETLQKLEMTYLQELKAQFGSDQAKIMDLYMKNRNMLGDKLKEYNNTPLFDSVISYLKNFVRTEDYDKALERVRRILGKDFNFDTYSNLPFAYDKNKNAMVYVYGVCTSNGIRLFRDAKTNRVKRGTAYHEAFHRVSMLLMNSTERQKMYDALTQVAPEMINAIEVEKQEYLADMFAKYVLHQVRNENPLYRFLDKLATSLKSLINRLRNRIDKVDGVNSLNKLFNDMYAGKYAYLLVSKENKEYFELAFGYDPLFSAFKYNGVEIAKSQEQFNDIYRNILAQVIKDSGFKRSENGQINIDYNKTLDYYKNEAKVALEMVTAAMSSTDISDLKKAMDYKIVVDGIVSNWKSWKKYLQMQMRTKFAIERIEDPNNIDMSDFYDSMETVETTQASGSMAKTIQNDDSIIASYMRNQFKSLDADVKLIFYTITDDVQMTPDGLHKYTNVFQLWHELCMGCQEAESVDDMIDIIDRMAKDKKREGKVNTMRQVVDILKDPNTSNQLKTKIFVGVVKYVNDFVAINFRNEDGKMSASIEDSNQEKSSRTSKKVWLNGMINTLTPLRQQFAEMKPIERSKAVEKWFKENIPTTFATSGDLTKLLTALGVTVDERDVVKFLDKNKANLKEFQVNLKQNLIKIKSILLQADKEQFEPSKILDVLFNPTNNTSILQMSEQIGKEELGSAKNDTVRIAGGAVAYIIGQYNHITRLFNRKLKDKLFIERFKNNAYTKAYKPGNNKTYYGSKWLTVLAKNKALLRTFVATVADSDYHSSNDFMGISGIEDMLNKFTTAMQGLHSIPELANKKTQYLIGNIPMEYSPLQLLGNQFSITESAIDTFRGYILSECHAIREACRERQDLVNKINKVMGKKYTYQDISNMSQEEQELWFKRPDIAPFLGKLRLFYHYSAKSGKPTKNSDGTFTRRSFGINLEKGNGYKSRHFSELVDKLGINENTTDRELYQMLNHQYTIDFIKSMITWNIQQVLQFMNDKKIISGYDSEKSLGNQNITNHTLPENVIRDNKSLRLATTEKQALSSNDIIKAVGYFVMNNMCDNIEFEKIVSGDIAEYKNMDGVNKRYSAQTSTTSIKNNKGTIRNEFVEDELYESDTYRTIEINTTKVDNLAKFKYEAQIFLGVDAFNEELNVPETLSGKLNDDGTPKYNCLDYRKLLDKDGNLTKEAKQGMLVKQFLQHRDLLRSYGVFADNSQIDDVTLAKRVTDNCYIRLIGYRNVDPTDAQTWVSADFNRQLKQREGEWGLYEEACHNLLEHYDELDLLERANKNAYSRMLRRINIDQNEITDMYNKFKSGQINHEEYRGYILGKTQGFIQGSLKYVFFGATNGSTTDPIFHLYDKTSLSPVYKIFAQGHDMEKLYRLMKENKVHMIKMESCTKTGNIPSFELYKPDGSIDEEAFRNAPKQDQLFEHLGKQLNTEPHESTRATLLTQFMKIAVMNIVPTNKYRLNNKNLTGSQLLGKYQNILDILTVRGYHNFCKEFGVNPDNFEVDKLTFMSKLQDMASTQGVTSEMLDALNVNENGDYVIHPSALPNINWIQSRLISMMDKTIIKTVTPGKPLFQVSSVGYDNILKSKLSADKTLKSYDENGFMQVKLSISLFGDVLKKAGLQNASFKEQREFLLRNQDILFATSYRVPTQGQNSTLPIKVVDVFEPQRGDIIMFPSDITALTGSDFDIDKMFLANYNVEVVDGVARRVQYDINKLEEMSDEALQNALLDMYLMILSSDKHRVDAVTPLDVTTEPLKQIKTEIENLKGKAEDARAKQPGWYLNPLFQVELRIKNAGSSNGIGPMALNNVFRFFIQMSGLDMYENSYLKGLGLSLKDNGQPRIFDRNGENILDSTSALINAHVDAVKDNYIGRMNVNDYTFDVVSALISNGMGNDTYWFLGQPILCDVAENYNDLKHGQVGVDEERAAGNKFLYEIRDAYIEKILNPERFNLEEKASVEEMSTATMSKNIVAKNTDEWYAQQLRYLNTFLYIKSIAEDYRKALTSAQIDTGKYGINANDIINFMQSHDQFVSDYNVTFKNPNDLFEKTFLGAKYDNGVSAIFKIFSNILLEFSPGYVNTINQVAKQLGIYGPYGKELMRRFGQRLKTAIIGRFFNSYIMKMYPKSATPLHELLAGANTVVDRFNEMKELSSYTDEGKALFDVLIPSMKATGQPKFFIIDGSVSDDADVKANVAQAWEELYESADDKLSQYAKDLAVYMFYVTGGTDANASGRTKTSIFDLVPPKLLADLKVGDMTYNQYIQNLMELLSQGTYDNDGTTAVNTVSEDYVNIAKNLTALFDDNFAKVLNRKSYNIVNMFGSNDVVMIKKGSDKLLDYNTGLYRPYIKIKTPSGQYDTYKLGDIKLTKQEDKTYINPVYYKVGKVGYRNSKLPMYAIRADGYIDREGRVASLLYGKSNYPTNSKELDLSNKSHQVQAKGMIPVTDSVDFSQLYDQLKGNYTYTGFNIPYADYAAIDSADLVIYINDGEANVKSLVNYAQFKRKPFMVYDEKAKLSSVRGRVYLIGNASESLLNEIISKLPKNVIYVASNESNNIGNMVMNKIVKGEISGEAYGEISDTLIQESTDANQTQQNNEDFDDTAKKTCKGE